MVFAIISVLLFLIWRLSSKQRKLISASFFMLMGTLLFVGLGLEYDRYENITLSIVIVVIFYIFLVIGERVARLIRLDERGFCQVGDFLVNSRLIRTGFLVLFVVYAVLPLARVLVSGQSVSQLLTATWASNSLDSLSQTMLENTTRSGTGLEALLDGVQRQLIGFWYLSLGVALVSLRSQVVFPILVVYLLGTFMTGSSSRTVPMMAALLPIMIWLSSAKRLRVKNILVAGAIALAIVISLDSLVMGRAGSVAEGTLGDRVERSLRVNFAYGGLGLQLGMLGLPDSPDRGIDYLIQTAALPIPRVLWPDKPSANPNQVFTEWYTGLTVENLGSLLLFTPLGEALFNFGYFGLALVPFLYGFTVTLLERLYSTSDVYKGLLIQVYLWAFVGMRLTYFNLFATLIAANFVLLFLLVAGRFLVRGRARGLSSSVGAYRGRA
jgi:hypothetical protein